MESYKHSCPFCGQHVEYTAEYCGQQMQCPSCGKTITFPAIPPGRGRGAPGARVKELDARRAAAKPARSWLRNAPEALAFLRDFEHWNVVGQCAVPFLIIAVLLAGAIFVKSKFSAASAPPAAPAMQADPDAWQRIADLTKADVAVRALLKEYAANHATVLAAERTRQNMEKQDPSQKKSFEEQLQLAQNTLTATQKRLDAALEKYRKLGGTVDYYSQMRNN
jgi:hypothetical protein